MGLVGTLIAVLAIAVVGVGGTAAYLYASDYKADASVQDDCSGGAVPVKTKLLGLEYTVRNVPAHECVLLHKGNFVEYRIRSKHTTLYEVEGGRCIYDTLTGPGCGGTGFVL